MKLDKISTEDLVLELRRRNTVQVAEVFEGAGFKIRLPCNRIIRDKGSATILICKNSI